MLKTDTSRRAFLAGASAVALTNLADVKAAVAAPHPALRGIYPIAQTPCTPDNKLDLPTLAAQVKFCTRVRVPGVVWPQLASGWATLSESERTAGAEALLAAAKGSSTQVVIGVQALENDRAQSERLARHAATHGASAIISLPPEKVSDAQVVDYYKAIGEATPLPLMIQTIGNMGTSIIGDVYKQVPTLACVKDEAGDALTRISDIRARTDNKVSVFAGKAAHTLLNEMALGFDGNCPAFTLCDLLQRTWEKWHSGQQREAFDLYGRYAAFMTIPNVDPYGMIARGFFPETARIRVMPNGKDTVAMLSDSDKRFIKHVFDDFLISHLSIYSPTVAVP
jgi:dihydrodipicolinate synthase/N-acetylneuraminate lyase